MSDALPARVGVVVRTQNRPKLLTRALEDIAAQQFQDLTVVVVNDGGPAPAVEASVEGVRALSARIHIVHHPHAQGRSAAANAGLRSLATEYVVLHDDDDLWHPEFLRRTVDQLDANPGDAGALARIEIVYEALRNHQYVEIDRALFWPQLLHLNYSDLLTSNRAVPIGLLYRAALHEVVGYYREDLDAVEDWDFYLRVTLDHRIALLDGPPLAFWTQRVAVDGPDGNSMFVLSADHSRFDERLRDDALRDYVRRYGPGIPLYLARLIRTELERHAFEQRGIRALIVQRARRWRHRRRGR